MTNIEKVKISVAAEINSPVEKVWNYWTDPKHIVHWNNASEDWHTPRAESDFRVDGKFLSRMEARDRSNGFDFIGVFDRIEHFKLIEYTLGDGRKVSISFVSKGNGTLIDETFDSETENPIELQRSGWQSILNNFKKYVESSGRIEPMHFEVAINSKAGEVYKTMLDEKTYNEWTAEFNPTSHFKGSWEKGSKILFLGTDRNGKTGGMVSRIKENIPEKYLSIEHMGIVQDGKEIVCGPEIDGWAGSLENYTFTAANGQTLVEVDIDSNNDFKSYFSEKWPKALSRLKTICER
jgi:uncharacterized protein YndB with AHSA1/START domain